jgi:single-strand DNA-binding protein
MSDINSVTLVGRLTEKPVLRYTNSGKAVTTLKIANNTFLRGSDGKIESKPNFFNVIVWGKSAENCAKYLDKGKQVAIQGRLDYRKWTDNSGKTRSTIEIIAQRVQFIGGPSQIETVPSALEEVEPETEPIPEEIEKLDETAELQDEFNEPISDDEVPF